MKTKLAAILTLTLLSIQLHASLLKNGDFERGGNDWDGDRRVEYETEDRKNSVCRMRLRRKDQEFSQEIRTRRVKNIILKYKVKKSSDYQGRGYSIRFTRDDGSYTFYESENLQNEWSNEVLKFSDIDESKDILLSFIVRSGSRGHLDFDDIEVFGSQ